MTIVDLVPPPAGRPEPSPVHAEHLQRRRAPRPLTLAAASRPRLAVIHPSAVIRAGIPLLLTGFTVTGQFATTERFLEQRPAAEIVMLDIPASAAADAAPMRRLARAGYRVCLYTAETRPAVLIRYLTAGARGLVAQSDSVEALAGALARIAAGGTVISPTHAGLPTSGPLWHQPTPRQLQILSGRARGETFHSIARRLEISERTAQDHWSAIARRFDVFLKTHSPADLERSLGLDGGIAPLEPGDCG